MEIQVPASSWPLPVGLHPALVGGRGCYLTGEDHLRISTFNAAASAVLAIEGRILNPIGQIVPFAARHVPNTDRTTATTIIPIGDGWLLDVVVRATAGTPRVGQCFAILELVRGVTGAVTPVAFLSSGYVTDTSRFSWPSSVVKASTEGPGVIRSITGTDPAANTEISETVPTNARWRLLAVHAVLVTDANAANRIPVLILDDGTTDFCRSPHSTNQAASLTRRHTWGDFGASLSNTDTGVLNHLPGTPLLMGGFRIRTATVALQATDNWGAPQLLVEEWIED